MSRCLDILNRLGDWGNVLRRQLARVGFPPSESLGHVVDKAPALDFVSRIQP